MDIKEKTTGPFSLLFCFCWQLGHQNSPPTLEAIQLDFNSKISIKIILELEFFQALEISKLESRKRAPQTVQWPFLNWENLNISHWILSGTMNANTKSRCIIITLIFFIRKPQVRLWLLEVAYWSSLVFPFWVAFYGHKKSNDAKNASNKEEFNLNSIRFGRGKSHIMWKNLEAKKHNFELCGVHNVDKRTPDENASQLNLECWNLKEKSVRALWAGGCQIKGRA